MTKSCHKNVIEDIVNKGNRAFFFICRAPFLSLIHSHEIKSFDITIRTYAKCLFFFHTLNHHFRREASAHDESYIQKIVDNTYAARLKRLKEELNGPTVTEIIQMHKFQEKNQTFDSSNKATKDDDIFEESPAATIQLNSTTQPSESDTMPLDSQSFDRDR